MHLIWPNILWRCNDFSWQPVPHYANMCSPPTLSPLLAFLLPSRRLFTHVMPLLLPLLLPSRRASCRSKGNLGEDAALFRSLAVSPTYFSLSLSLFLPSPLLMHLIIVGRCFRMLICQLVTADEGGGQTLQIEHHQSCSSRSHFKFKCVISRSCIFIRI